MHLSDAEFEAVKMRTQGGRPANVTIVSDSMSPLIKVGERVEVSYKDHYKSFDVVIYHHRDGRLICHYIWQKSRLEEGSYLLRSLKGTAFDLPVALEKILGHVTGKKLTGKWQFWIFFKLIKQRFARGLFS